MSDIDDQVAGFRSQLDGLMAFDVDQVAADLAALTKAITTAPGHVDAAVALREFIDARPDHRTYAYAVVYAALQGYGMHVMLTAPIDDLPGPDGHLSRILRLAYAARGLGLPEWASSPIGGSS